MEKTAIVVVTYSRYKSLNRILNSIEAADYTGYDDIPLIISIDGGGDEKVAQAAEAFNWSHGKKEVIKRGERMGLKAHILSCGDITENYEGIIMLEDDLYVSPYFYDYAVEALEFAKDKDKIGGISLYAHKFNVFARLPFEPLNDGYSNWYFKFASSWGQAWSREQWKGFRDWLRVHDGTDISGNGLPENVAQWGEKSWLKYAIKYLIETDKYFLYPRVSYTTNFADEGEHASESVTDLQVPLCVGRENYNFSDPDNAKAVYDAYFENEKMGVNLDIYGIKARDGAFGEGPLLSTAPLGKKVIQTYGLKLKPADLNVLYKSEGNDLFLYDTSIPADPPSVSKGKLYGYFYPGINQKKILSFIKYGFQHKMKGNKK
ncbi:MAG: glycosyltransferase family 2 protein [Lachnospiraceae bacterium]|nr:glycosyltransferase family 2 protein [Lachnospiraceae bacterium]